MRTDYNRNPTAFTTAVAEQAGLKLGIDYEIGTSFYGSVPFGDSNYMVTARILGDPIATTIRVINAMGFVTRIGNPRWLYINMPKFIWDSLFDSEKRDVIGFMYRYEGGSAMIPLFPNYHLT